MRFKVFIITMILCAETIVAVPVQQPSSQNNQPTKPSASKKVLTTEDIGGGSSANSGKNEAAIQSYNKDQAMDSLRLIFDKQLQYREVIGKGNFADAAGLFKEDLISAELANASGVPAIKSRSGDQTCPGDGSATSYGYKFKITSTKPTGKRRAGFKAVAILVDQSGKEVADSRSFYINEEGEVKQVDDQSEAIANPQPVSKPVSKPVSQPASRGSYRIDSESKEPPPAIIRLAEGIIRGHVVYQEEPKYPATTEQLDGNSGDVWVEITISEAGDVSEARIISGHPVLREPALTAAKRWKFYPTLVNNQAVKVSSTLIFQFKR